jgi:hypothetical protein
MIVPLQKMVWSSKAIMRRTTLSEIMWTVFRQGCSFALGEMHKNGLDRTAEWSTACVHNIQSHMDFDLLTIPLTLKRITYVENGW